jgi:predicted dehydrogenase
MRSSRRVFLKATTTAAAAVSAPMVVPARVFGANEEILMGQIGLGVRGVGAHIPGFASQKGVRVIAVADPDSTRTESAAKMIETKYGYKADSYQDMRRIFDRKEINAVGNATMQYWHALSTIWACQAGKHVYVEKPLSHYIWEGRQMVNAARKYGRIVQIGTQRRADSAIPKMIAWLREGHLGKIQAIYCFAYKPRTSCGKRTEPLPIPPTLDYDLWCGPAKKEPIYRDRLQYDCSFTWDKGDAESCNQGVHEVDVARWILGTDALPRRVMSIGGRFLWDDACDVPNTQIICYDFPESPVFYEARNLRAAKNSTQVSEFRGERVGVIVECEGGSLSVYRHTAWDKSGKQVATFSGGGDIFANFIEALRRNDPKHLVADIEGGHLSTRICHVGNISYRVGKPASLADQRTVVHQGPPGWEAWFERYLEHLGAHQIDPNTATLGPWLECDTPNECIKDHPEANKIVRGWYREPYVVPEIRWPA